MGKTFEKLFRAALTQEEKNEAALAAALEPIKADLDSESNDVKIRISVRSMRSPLTGLVALMAIAGLILFALFQANDIQKVLAYRSLERGIASADLATVDRALDNIFSDLSSVAWINTAILEAPEVDPFQATGSRELYEIYSAVYSGDMDRAITRFEGLNNFQLLRVLSMQGSQKGSEIMKALETSFANYKESRARIDKFQSELVELSQKSSNARDEFNLLLRDFGDLFSFDTRRDVDSESAGSGYYSSGVLEGLPAIKQLPDDIPDLVSLKQELDRAGGEVAISGEDAHGQFVNKVGGLKEGFRRLRDEIEASDKAYLAGQAETEKLRTESFKERQFLLNQLRLTLTAAAEPDVGKMAKSLAVLFEVSE